MAGRDPGMLETARKRLRALVRLIDRRRRAPIYTDFEDQIGDESEISLPGFDLPIYRTASSASGPKDAEGQRDRWGSTVKLPSRPSPAF